MLEDETIEKRKLQEEVSTLQGQLLQLTFEADQDVEKLGQDSSKGTPEESPRDSSLFDFSQEKPNNENETLADEASSEGSSPGHPEEPVVEAAEVKGIEKEADDSDEVFTLMHAKGEDE
ncbi:hypothetical protein Droror1_Dr00009370 [Drosera rotundifolia]